MAANAKLLNNDKTTDFTSYAFGNILAGATSEERLLFVYSYGTVDAEDVTYGTYATPGNDGYTFTQVCSGSSFNASGSSVTGTVSGTGGSIGASPATLSYKISVKDAFSYESDLGTEIYTTPTLTGSTNRVLLTWSAVSGASTYGVYVDKGSGYKLITFTASTNYTDLYATPTATDPQASGSVAYRANAWGAGPLSLGTLTSGTKLPVYFREVIPSGTLATGNPRSHQLYLSFTVV